MITLKHGGTVQIINQGVHMLFVYHSVDYTQQYQIFCISLGTHFAVRHWYGFNCFDFGNSELDEFNKIFAEFWQSRGWTLGHNLGDIHRRHSAV